MKRSIPSTAPGAVNDDDLILLYYGEAEDPQLAQRVAQSAELSARFEQLCHSLAVLDQLAVPEPSAAQNALRWARLAPQLAAIPALRPSIWQQLHALLLQPRWSVARLASLVLVVSLAFWLGGRWSSQRLDPVDPYLAAAHLNVGQANAGLDIFVARHLQDAERWLSHIQNQGEVPSTSWTARLLRDNRVYRLSLQNPTLRATLRQGHQLYPLLQQLEQELLLFANPGPMATAGAASDLHHLQRLLFQLRVLNQQGQSKTPNSRGHDYESTIRT